MKSKHTQFKKYPLIQILADYLYVVNHGSGNLAGLKSQSIMSNFEIEPLKKFHLKLE